MDPITMWVAVGLYVSAAGEVRTDRSPIPFDEKTECEEFANEHLNVVLRPAILAGQLVAYSLECKQVTLVLPNVATEITPLPPEKPDPKKPKGRKTDA